MGRTLPLKGLLGANLSGDGYALVHLGSRHLLQASAPSHKTSQSPKGKSSSLPAWRVRATSRSRVWLYEHCIESQLHCSQSRSPASDENHSECKHHGGRDGIEVSL